MKPTHVYLLRHGETDWNREYRLQGHRDIGLNPTGQEQAAELARRLAGIRLDAVYASDLARARATAEPLARGCGLEVRVRTGLRERNYGVFEGLTAAQIGQNHPEDYRRWRTHDPHFVIPGGESLAGFRDRIHRDLEELARSHPGQVIAVVTHGGALDMVYRRSLGLSWHGPRACAIPNAAVNEVRIGPTSWEIVTWAGQPRAA